VHQPDPHGAGEAGGEALQRAGCGHIDGPGQRLREATRSHGRQITGRDKGFVGPGREVATHQGEHRQRGETRDHADARRDPDGVIELLLIDPVRPGVDLLEQRDEFGHRVDDRVDPVLDGRFELCPADTGRQPAKRRDEIVGQRVAHLGEPLIPLPLFGGGTDVAGGQYPQPDVEGELPEQRRIGQIGHGVPP
jgi:hypothetical protein